MLHVLATLALCSVPCPQSGPGKNPIELDKTGVPWAASFADALARAKTEKRLLFLLPDNWAPSENGELGLECFRAGPLCDERVRALLELRFVCFYFNCFDQTAAFDADALAFVVPEKKEFAKEEQRFDGGIPALVMTPQGKLVGEVGSYMPIDSVLEELLHALKKNGDFDSPSVAEKAAKEPLARGRFLCARGEYEKAEAQLAKAKEPEARALRARIARIERDWKRHKKIVAEMEPASADAALERAYALIAESKFEQAATELQKVDAASERGDEARYVEGLARYGAKDQASALALWKALVEGRPQGPWIYRADWAYTNVVMEANIGNDAARTCPSLLHREGYLGPRNPDLPTP